MPALLVLWVIYSLTRESEDAGTTRRECSLPQRRWDEEDGIALEAMFLSIAVGAGTLGVLVLVRFFVRWPFGSWLSWATMIAPGATAFVTAVAYTTWHSWCRSRRLRKAK